jgi:hypothetical protein
MNKKSNEIELLKKVFFFIFFPGPERASLYGGQEQHQQTGKIEKLKKKKNFTPDHNIKACEKLCLFI